MDSTALGMTVTRTLVMLPGVSYDSSLYFPACGFFLTSISNRHECWPPVASNVFTYNLRIQNFKLWYETFLILFVAAAHPGDESLWPRSHKQLATLRVAKSRSQGRGQCYVQEKRIMLCKQNRKFPAFPLNLQHFQILKTPMT